MVNPEFKIGPLRVGAGSPCLVIAEAGVNHNGDFEMALRLCDAAKEVGADAVKFQTFRTQRMVSNVAPMADYQNRNVSGFDSQAEMLKRLELTDAEFEKLAEHAQSMGILFLSTPFDFESVELLKRIKVPAFKLSSGDLTNHLLIQAVATAGVPMILSTGMAVEEEVDQAIRVAVEFGCRDLAVLQCVTDYPAAPSTSNLKWMQKLAGRFSGPVGYSDHTEGSAVSLAAVALGARILEKHLTLDRSLPGPDHRASMEPAEFRQLISMVREVESSLGDGIKRPTPQEMRHREVARKSLFAACEIRAGEVVEMRHLDVKRPGDGIPPQVPLKILGMKARRSIAAGEKLNGGFFEHA